jgi:hypothetical protein
MPRLRPLTVPAIAAAVMITGCSSTENPSDAGPSDAGAAPDTAAACSGTIPRASDCNTCYCTAAGTYACTTIACPTVIEGGTTAACSLAGDYDYGDEGGNAAVYNRSYLSTPATYQYQRQPADDATSTIVCTLALPACGTAGAIDPTDIDTAVADPDVRAALAMATPPVYGHDSRPVDGTVFSFRSAAGGGLAVGGTCGSGETGCTPPPAGVARLVTLLRMLDQQELSSPACTAARPPL